MGVFLEHSDLGFLLLDFVLSHELYAGYARRRGSQEKKGAEQSDFRQYVLVLE